MRGVNVTMTGHKKCNKGFRSLISEADFKGNKENIKLRIKTCKKGQVWSDKTCENLEQVWKCDQVW